MIIRLGIVDDHLLFIDGIKSILSSEMDIEIVAEASNGVDMLLLIEAGVKMDVLMTDIRMPRMDGLQLSKRINEGDYNISVLVLSMFDQVSDVRDVVKSGANGYLPKNVEKQEMLLAIRTLYKGMKYYAKEYERVLDDHVESDEVVGTQMLTKREKQILELIGRGKTSIDIAKTLSISKLTVDTHRKNIHRKLKIESNAGLIRYALRQVFPADD